VHSYYHLVPLDFVIALWVISPTVDYSRFLYLEWFIDVGVFPRISTADEETFGFTHGHGV
jgi:hypothetical protein